MSGRVFQPKLAGAWNLHRQTQEAELDFFVLFSSVTAIVGSAGQVRIPVKLNADSAQRERGFRRR